MARRSVASQVRKLQSTGAEMRDYSAAVPRGGNTSAPDRIFERPARARRRRGRRPRESSLVSRLIGRLDDLLRDPRDPHRAVPPHLSDLREELISTFDL